MAFPQPSRNSAFADISLERFRSRRAIALPQATSHSASVEDAS